MGFSENTAVSSIRLDKKSAEAYYSIVGHPANSNSRGMIIVRMSNGTTKKIVK